LFDSRYQRRETSPSAGLLRQDGREGNHHGEKERRRNMRRRERREREVGNSCSTTQT